MGFKVDFGSSALASTMVRWSPWLSGVLVIAFLLGGVMLAPTSIERLRFSFFDSLQRHFPWTEAQTGVTVIDIDEASLAQYGQWPWPRSLLARLVTQLRAQGAAAIAFDMVFAEPDRASPARLIADLPASARTALAGTPIPDYDADFTAAIAGGGVTLGFGLLPEANGRTVSPKASFAVIGGDIADYVPHLGGAVPNLPAFEQAAAGLGSFTVVAGHDEIVRRLPLLSVVGDQVVPSLALEALRVADGDDTLRVRLDRTQPGGPLTGMTLRLGDSSIPLDRDGALLLHHRPANSVTRVSAAVVLGPGGPAVKALIANHVVFVGTSAVGLNDLRPTPLNPFEPGVDLHANAVDQMLQGHFLDRPSWAAGAELVTAIGAGLVMLTLLTLFGLGAASVTAVVLILGLIGGGVWAFTARGLLLDPTLPVLSAALVFILAGLARHFLAERRGAGLARALATYMSPALAREVARNPDQVRLGGELREMSFVFTDLEGFTSLTETIGPERLVSVLNAYLDGLCRIALDNGGTVDKIVGDAVHVMFNAPLRQPDHAERAVRTALEMARFGITYATACRAEGLHFGRTRVGVNTGPAIVGNFGGSTRFDYTAHGDAINTAARLEAANKGLGSTVLISRATLDAAGSLAARPLGELLLRGKSKRIEVFEPLSGDDPALAYRDRFADLVASLRVQPAAAATALASLAAQYADDAVLVRLVERIGQGEAIFLPDQT